MDNSFKEAFDRFKFLKLSDLVSLFKICSIKKIPKGELIVSEGEYTPFVFLIIKGIIRTYVLDSEGEEKTIRLAKEKDFSSPAECFLNDKPSKEYLEALEDCNVIVINNEKFKKLADENIRILKLSYNGVKEAFNDAIRRIEFFTVLTPEQRYKDILENRPELLQRVQQKHLASYLGITTVSLSRIRNRS